MIQDSEKYLLVRIAKELIAVPLMYVREVMEYQRPKPMPNMKSYFVGVINVRGALVGVVDLRMYFGCESLIDARTTMLYCDHESTSLMVIVDRVEGIMTLPETLEENLGYNKSIVPQIFVANTVFHADRLIVVADLKRLVSSMSLTANSTVVPA